MRAFDVVGIGLSLVLVPLLAWWLGRFAGRRDWRISSILIASIILAITVQIDVLAVLAVLEGRVLPFSPNDMLLRLGRRIVEAASSPEFSVFLLIFAAFIGMLGWSSTPANKPA
jgi:MFS family permease